MTAFHTSTHSVLQPIAIVIDGGVECPVHLGSGERAQSPTQFHYMLLFLIARFHILGVLEVKKIGLNIDFCSGFGSGGSRLGLSLRS